MLIDIPEVKFILSFCRTQLMHKYSHTCCMSLWKLHTQQGEPISRQGVGRQLLHPLAHFTLYPLQGCCPFLCNVLDWPRQIQLPQNGVIRHNSASKTMGETYFLLTSRISFTEENYVSSTFLFYECIQLGIFWRKTLWPSMSSVQENLSAEMGQTSLHNDHLYNFSDLPKGTRTEGKLKLPPLILSVPD